VYDSTAFCAEITDVLVMLLLLLLLLLVYTTEPSPLFQGGSGAHAPHANHDVRSVEVVVVVRPTPTPGSYL
jgi:hypothetical protein